MFFYSYSYVFILGMVPLIYLLFIVSKNLKSESRRFYFITLFTFVMWLLFNFLYVNSPNEKIALFFFTLLFYSVSTGTGALFLTAACFKGDLKIHHYLFAFIPFVSTFFVKKEIILTPFGWQGIHGIDFLAWELINFAVILAGVSILLKIRSEIKNKDLKKRLLFLSSASFLSIFLAIIWNVLAVYLGLPYISTFIASLSLLLTYPAFKK